MTKSTRLPIRPLRFAAAQLSVLIGGLALAASSAQALEAHPGDAVAPPPGMGLVGLYAIHTDLGPLRVQGQTVQGPKATADVGLLRLFYATRLGNVQINPQMVIPFGRVAGKGTLSGLESASGVGDVSVLASVMLVQDPASRSSVYLMPGVTFKTGSYDPLKLSIGENRNKYVLQLGGQTGLGKYWIVDGYLDLTAYGDNARNAGAALSQKPLLTLQSFLRYAVAPGSELAFGLRHFTGAETSLAGVAQHDGQSHTSFLLNGSHWLSDGKTQLMFNWGRDLNTENGFKATSNFELRAIRLF